jgi:hypothetical protein
MKTLEHGAFSSFGSLSSITDSLGKIHLKCGLSKLPSLSQSLELSICEFVDEGNLHRSGHPTILHYDPTFSLCRLFNVSSSVGIIMINKSVMKVYGFNFGRWFSPAERRP